MNIFSATCLLASFFAIGNAAAIYNLNSKSPVNITFSLFTLSFAASCFCLANISSVSTYDMCRFWYKVNVPFGTFLPVLALHFSMFLACKRKLVMNPVVLILIYLLPVFFIYNMLFNGFFEADFKLTFWGWDSVLDHTAGYNWIFTLLYSIPLSLSTYFIWIWLRKSGSKKRLLRLSDLIFPYISGMLAIILNPYFWYIKDNETLNFLLNMFSIFTFLIFLAGTRRIVKKLNFMKIRGESRVNVLIGGMIEPAILSDIECNIICYNNSASQIIKNFGGKRINNIFEFDGISEELKNSIKSLIENEYATGEVEYRNLTDRKNMRNYIVVIKKFSIDEKYSSGLLWFLKEDYSVSDFIIDYGITERQMSIIRLALAGCSNKKISEKLGITERTVENHFFNIYNKIGIDNRIELYNIASKYGIISD